jgi:hypothetical protein
MTTDWRPGTGMVKRVTYWSGAATVPEAVESAKAAARDEGWVIKTVARVGRGYRGDALGWDVELALREREPVA